MSSHSSGDWDVDSQKICTRVGDVHLEAARILAGVERPTAGQLVQGDTPLELRSPRDASALGIGVIHQELSLFPDLSVTDNVFMARERTRRGFVVDRVEQEARVREALERLEHPIDPSTLVGRLIEAFRTAGETVGVLGFCMGGMYTLKAAGSGRFHRAVRLDNQNRDDVLIEVIQGG